MLKKYTWLWLFVLLCLAACKKEEAIEYPVILTGEVTHVSDQGATFQARISNFGNKKILEWGFLVSTSENPTLQNGAHVFTAEHSNQEFRSFRVHTSIVKDEVYVVRAYLKTNNEVIYGNQVKFSSKGSQPPVLKGYYPAQARLGDTLTITGSNLWYIKIATKVFFDDVEARVIYATTDTLKAIVPTSLDKNVYSLSVHIASDKYPIPEKFSLIKPEISHFYPKVITWGSTVTVVGKNLKSPAGDATLMVNGVEARYYGLFGKVNATGDTIRFSIHTLYYTWSADLSIQLFNIKSVFAEPMLLDPFVLTDFTPKRTMVGSTVLLKGNNFGQRPSEIWVNIGGMNVQPDRITPEGLEVTLPSMNYSGYRSRENTISVRMHALEQTYNEKLFLLDPWLKIRINTQYGYYSKAFEIGRKIYFIDYSWGSIHQFNPHNGDWKTNKIANGFTNISFAIGKYIYLSLQGDYYYDNPQIIRYDTETGKSTLVASFPGLNRDNAVSFAIDGYGYVVGGKSPYNNGNLYDIWRYDPTTDQWAVYLVMQTAEEKDVLNTGIETVTIAEGKAYLKLKSTSQKVYYFDPSSSQKLRRIKDFPVAGGVWSSSFSFTIRNIPYFIVGQSNLYYYSSANDSWVKVNTTAPFSYSGGTTATLDNQVYIKASSENYLWLFDPHL